MIEHSVVAAIAEHQAILTCGNSERRRWKQGHDEQSSAIRFPEHSRRYRCVRVARGWSTENVDVDSSPVQWFRTLNKKCDGATTLLHTRRRTTGTVAVIAGNCVTSAS